MIKQSTRDRQAHVIAGYAQDRRTGMPTEPQLCDEKRFMHLYELMRLGVEIMRPTKPEIVMRAGRI
jgi:hypothetical protein